MCVCCVCVRFQFDVQNTTSFLSIEIVVNAELEVFLQILIIPRTTFKFSTPKQIDGMSSLSSNALFSV